MSLKQEYERLMSEREGFLEQAREHSRLTVPSLVPEDSFTGSYSSLYKPFQSVGASGVNGLANKLVGALYPSQQPFFRFVVKPTAAEAEGVDPATLEATDVRLSELEQDVMEQFAARGDRAAITECLKHLVVAGNCLLAVDDKRSAVYSLDRFVAERDGRGTLLRAITKDVLDYETFKEEFGRYPDIEASHQGKRTWSPKTIEVYTVMVRENGYWCTWEEAAGTMIPNTKRKSPIDEPPMLALRFNRIDGQSYGRGYVENLFGDLRSLEVLSQALVEASALSARVLFLVNPNGYTNQRAFERAPNGAVLPGSAADVSTIRVDKNNDLAVTAQEVGRLESRLNMAFMDRRAFQRDAERVTAAEITEMADQIEEVLGGVYAVLSEEFQRPYAKRLISLLQKSGDIPPLDKDLIDVSIVTGVSAIGRGADQQKMGAFFQALSQTLGADVIKEYINVPAAVNRLAASFGIKTKGLVKSQEEIEMKAQEAQQMALMQQAAPAAAGAMGDIMKQQAEIPQEETQDVNQQAV